MLHNPLTTPKITKKELTTEQKILQALDKQQMSEKQLMKEVDETNIRRLVVQLEERGVVITWKIPKQNSKPELMIRLNTPSK